MPIQLSSSPAALLIEPDPDMAKVFQELLSSAYHASVSLDVVPSLQDGLTYLQTHHVPLILMNLSLPDHAGRGAVERVRQAASATAIIGFHKTTDAMLLADAIRAGAHEVLPVIPPSAETLRLSITSALIRATRPLTTTEPILSADAIPMLSMPLAEVAHKLNNCLTSITGYTDILLTRLSVGDPSLRYAEQIKLSCTQAENLVKQLPHATSPSPVPQLATPTNNAPAA